MQSSTWPLSLHAIICSRLPAIQDLGLNLWWDWFGIKGRMRPKCARSHFPHTFKSSYVYLIHHPSEDSCVHYMVTQIPQLGSLVSLEWSSYFEHILVWFIFNTFFFFFFFGVSSWNHIKPHIIQIQVFDEDNCQHLKRHVHLILYHLRMWND